ncbi:helix-turn-helix domain-containing protein [Dysgonomonas sp. BGC7]|uniref:helix-turn-helix domain-containing protein n=1 Tax=Dysgonomonas sp. BGC7 TaxID=1658008 RepID=UPI000680922A|nr:helix-turn-helix domain-containing protein [Dysgonomonas sp. BGC7]MBD8389639.1 helix-turn-helix domain-containing protein [Dysgonomonas sp. BGC7]
MQRTIIIPIREWNEAKSRLASIELKLDKILVERQKDLLTPVEVCEILKINRNTYQRYVKEGIIEQKKIGSGANSKAYVKRGYLERLIDEGCI